MLEKQPGALAPQRNRQPRECVNGDGARLDTAEVADQGFHTGIPLDPEVERNSSLGMTDEFSDVQES
jgi:hypothetical protein